MSYRCDHCAKKTVHGESHTHGRGVASHKFHKRAPRTKRLFKPNLHMARIRIDGVIKKMKLCTKCLRKLKTQNSKLKTTTVIPAKAGIHKNNLSV